MKALFRNLILATCIVQIHGVQASDQDSYDVRAVGTPMTSLEGARHLEFQNKLESLRVEDNYIPGTNPRPGSKMVRRPLSQYERDQKLHNLVLFSGHMGQHTGIADTTQEDKYYMIDSCWEEFAPDMVMDTNNPEHWQYFPSLWADCVVADDARFLNDDMIPHILRIMKTGAQLIFTPGYGMGWPSPAMGSNQELFVSDNGRSMRVSYDPDRSANEIIIASAQKKALENAQAFYGPMGCEVTLKTDCTSRKCFVLTKTQHKMPTQESYDFLMRNIEKARISHPKPSVEVKAPLVSLPLTAEEEREWTLLQSFMQQFEDITKSYKENIITISEKNLEEIEKELTKIINIFNFNYENDLGYIGTDKKIRTELLRIKGFYLDSKKSLI